MVCSNPIVQVIRHDAIIGVKQVLARDHLGHADFSHATLDIVRPAVQAFQIHAREIGVIFVQVVPLADSARLARDGVTHEALADISHLFSGFARNVKRFGDFFGFGFGLGLG